MVDYISVQCSPLSLHWCCFEKVEIKEIDLPLCWRFEHLQPTCKMHYQTADQFISFVKKLCYKKWTGIFKILYYALFFENIFEAFIIAVNCTSEILKIHCFEIYALQQRKLVETLKGIFYPSLYSNTLFAFVTRNIFLFNLCFFTYCKG